MLLLTVIAVGCGYCDCLLLLLLPSVIAIAVMNASWLGLLGCQAIGAATNASWLDLIGCQANGAVTNAIGGVAKHLKVGEGINNWNCLC